MNTINQDIKDKHLRQFYLLYGEEDYLKKQYKDRLVQASVDPEDNMNLRYFEGKRTDYKEIVELGETLPFFAEKRVLVVENTGWFKKAPEEISTKLLPRLSEFPETTCIIFVEQEVDKRGKLYKWVEKAGYASKMDTPDDKMLFAWIKGLCKDEEKQIEEAALFYFVEHIGSDMLLMKNELEKLLTYIGDRDVITVEDIRELCVGQAEENMFEMLDAIGACNQKKALLLYRDMLALRESAMWILSMLTRHFRILMQARTFLDKETGSGEMNQFFKENWRMQPFIVKKYAAQARNYTYDRLKSMVEECHLTDYRIKTGNVQDIVGVELLIVRFSEK